VTYESSMGARRKYIKRQQRPVVAVRVDLDTEGFTYRKWGGAQRCKAGDWIVDSDGEVYTVDGKVFAANYERLSLGVFVKTTPVFAERADRSGVIGTNEASTAYDAGDYLVSNDAQGTDAWAVPREKFERMYKPAD